MRTAAAYAPSTQRRDAAHDTLPVAERAAPDTSTHTRVHAANEGRARAPPRQPPSIVAPGWTSGSGTLRRPFSFMYDDQGPAFMRSRQYCTYRKVCHRCRSVGRAPNSVLFGCAIGLRPNTSSFASTAGSQRPSRSLLEFLHRRSSAIT